MLSLPKLPFLTITIEIVQLKLVLVVRKCQWGLTRIWNRPVTSLGHQAGRRVFWEGPKFFKLCPIVLNYIQHIFPGGASPSCAPLVTGLIWNDNWLISKKEKERETQYIKTYFYLDYIFTYRCDGGQISPGIAVFFDTCFIALDFLSLLSWNVYALLQYGESWVPSEKDCTICSCMENRTIACTTKVCPKAWTPKKPDCGPCHVAEVQRGTDPCCLTYQCGKCVLSILQHFFTIQHKLSWF